MHALLQPPQIIFKVMHSINSPLCGTLTAEGGKMTPAASANLVERRAVLAAIRSALRRRFLPAQMYRTSLIKGPRYMHSSHAMRTLVHRPLKELIGRDCA